jgi:hypothetical protein
MLKDKFRDNKHDVKSMSPCFLASISNSSSWSTLNLFIAGSSWENGEVPYFILTSFSCPFASSFYYQIINNKK